MISRVLGILPAAALRPAFWLSFFLTAAAFGAPPSAGAIDPRLGAPFLLRDRPSLGSLSAPIVVIAVSNFQCSHCQDFHREVFPELRKQYIDTGKVRWVMLNGTAAARIQNAPVFAVAHWSLSRGRYWQVEDFLFDHSRVAANDFPTLMAEHHLAEADEIAACLRPDSAARQEVAEDFAEIGRLKIPGTPLFYVRRWKSNGKFIQVHIYDYESLDYFGMVFAQLMGAR
jgi:hypothetical protein